ncbi:MAG: hypothetical protein U1F68_02355 [Gammaproteobacteria bacterium]
MTDNITVPKGKNPHGNEPEQRAFDLFYRLHHLHHRGPVAWPRDDLGVVQDSEFAWKVYMTLGLFFVSASLTLSVARYLGSPRNGA